MENKENINVKKRKRTANTSPEQLEQYLLVMESDSVFRTNTLNPTIPPDYIEKTWEKLTNKLNACDSGPVLAKHEWIKRFKDWKNSIRAKARKNMVSGKQTGGGPSEEIKLSPIEERALAVWGRVTVTGSSEVPVSGGFQQYLNENPKSPNIQINEVEEDLPDLKEVPIAPESSLTTTPLKKKGLVVLHPPEALKI